MTKNTKLMSEIKGELKRRENQISWLGLILALTTILKGLFILSNEGHFLNHVEPYFRSLPERPIGYVLISAGIIKLAGVAFRSKPLKRWGIWALVGLWSGYFGLALGYSFGSGYPHDSWIHTLAIAAICIYEARRGSFY